MVVETGEAINSGLPVPKNVPLHEPLYQVSTVPDPPVAVRVILPSSVEQKPDLSEEILVGAVAVGDNMISNGLLLVPVRAGLLLMTLTRYPVPDGVLAGMVLFIVSLLRLLTSVPITTGEAKEPLASDNCTE